MKLLIHFDGGSRGNPGPAGAGVVIRDGQGRTLFEAGFYLGRMTNNMAEYQGLLKGLEAAAQAKAGEIEIASDSELVVRQINGDYRVRNAQLRGLFDEALAGLGRFERWTIRHVPREANQRADDLANMAMDAGEDVILADRRVASAGARTLPAGPAGAGASTAGAGTSTAGAGIPPAGARIPSRTPTDENRCEPSRPVKKKPQAKADQPPANTTRVAASLVTARCVRPSNSEACAAPCEAGQEFVFDRTLPGGICLEIASQLLPAVKTVQKSGKPAKVYCPRSACGACFEVRSKAAETQ